MNKTKDKKIEKWIDLSELPRSKNGGVISWNSSIGYVMNFVYGKYVGQLTILEKIQGDKYRVLISTHDESFEYILNSNGIRRCMLGGTFARPIAITHPELMEYFVNKNDAYKYQAHSNAVVEMQCPLCGTKRDQSIHILTEFGLACPACSDGISYPNKLMYNAFKQLKINFKNEVTKATPGFEWIVGGYRYDFYFEYGGFKAFVEMDGKLHDGGRFAPYEKVHNADQTKNDLAASHGIKMIRINCKYSKIANRYEYVKTNIFNSELKFILDLQKIDWDMANSFAVDSNIRLAAELWNTEDYCAIDIGKTLGVSRDTARGYLKIAFNLGLCNYNDHEIEDRMIRRIDKNNKNKSKPIALYKNGNIINVFSGVVDLDRQSQLLYGTHMDFRNTYAVCKGSKKQAYGYTMKFITREEYEKFLPQFKQTIQN